MFASRAARLSAGIGAIGQRIEFVERRRPKDQPPATFDVVGIVASTRRQLFEKELPGAVYVPFAQGAKPGTVRRMILREGLSLTVVGVAIGLILGVGVGRLMASIFLDLEAFDPLAFGLVPAAFLVAAGVAAWFPARRATQVNPLAALRSE